MKTWDLILQSNGFRHFSEGTIEHLDRIGLSDHKLDIETIEGESVSFHVEEKYIASNGSELIDFLDEADVNLAKFIRKRSGASQNGFAARYQIPVHTLQNWEQGIREIPRYVAKMLLRLVEIDRTPRD